MDACREQIIQALNDAKLTADAQEKARVVSQHAPAQRNFRAQVGLLKQLQELLVHKQPLLLDEYIHEVAELQLVPSPAVKKALSEFIRAAAGATRSPTALLGCIRCAHCCTSCVNMLIRVAGA